MRNKTLLHIIGIILLGMCSFASCEKPSPTEAQPSADTPIVVVEENTELAETPNTEESKIDYQRIIREYKKPISSIFPNYNPFIYMYERMREEQLVLLNEYINANGIGVNINNSESLNSAGFDVYAKKDYVNAIRFFREAAYLNPESIFPHYNLACCLSLLSAQLNENNADVNNELTETYQLYLNLEHYANEELPQTLLYDELYNNLALTFYLSKEHIQKSQSDNDLTFIQNQERFQSLIHNSDNFEIVVSVDFMLEDLKYVRVYTKEDFENVEPIYDIDMVLVEGGVMEMRGKVVTVDSFYMNRYELTLQMVRQAYVWANNQGYGDYYPNYSENDNAVCLNPYPDSILLCNYLSMVDGYKPVYLNEDNRGPILDFDMSKLIIDWEADGYRLPTEAEWEFAARGGNDSKGYIFAGSNNLDEVAWFDTYYNGINLSNDDYLSNLPAGQKKPNELGLYDMSGNIAEWVINTWEQGDMLIPEHNPGRIPNIVFSKIAILKGNAPSPNKVQVYNPRTRIINDFREEGSDEIEFNRAYDYYAGELSPVHAIRLVRSKTI